ncbi:MULTISPECIES: NAD(P)-dependent alcohol dehydrogenase [unclassified Brachybacterium]|uniref:NAD(P)-dependent alcohol dehydrogenase n=1 Tax=unclassified Brachybacterium TaxID=2623841 RepID=UPI00402AA106
MTVKTTMRAGVLVAPGRISLEEREIPEIGPEDVLVRVAYVGLCGSDVALFSDGGIGSSRVEETMVLGHEASGVVAAVGETVCDLAVGDRVALEPGVPCGICEQCMTGHYNLCPDVYFWASLPITEGTLQEYVRHPARFCFALPDEVTLPEGALIEPLAVALHALRTSGAGLGSRALVLGGGSVGLLMTALLRRAGAAEVVVSDMADNRLDFAQEFGAEPIRADVLAAEATVADRRFDVVFETAGSEATMNEAIRCVRRGGTITFVGYTKSGIAALHVNDLIDKELTLRSVFRYRNLYPTAIALLASGELPVARIITDVLPLERSTEAFTAASTRKHEVVKVMIKVDAGAGDGRG